MTGAASDDSSNVAKDDDAIDVRIKLRGVEDFYARYFSASQLRVGRLRLSPLRRCLQRCFYIICDTNQSAKSLVHAFYANKLVAALLWVTTGLHHRSDREKPNIAVIMLAHSEFSSLICMVPGTFKGDWHQILTWSLFGSTR